MVSIHTGFINDSFLFLGVNLMKLLGFPVYREKAFIRFESMCLIQKNKKRLPVC